MIDTIPLGDAGVAQALGEAIARSTGLAALALHATVALAVLAALVLVASALVRLARVRAAALAATPALPVSAPGRAARAA